MQVRVLSLAVVAWLCLVALSTAASPEKQTPQANPLGLPDKSLSSGGALVVCGGGRTPRSVYDEFARLAGGKEAKIIIIPSAYPFSSTAAVERRYAGWRRYEPKVLDVLDAKSREQADAAAFNAKLGEATGVWLAGGYQSRLASIYAGTKAEATLRGVLERGGVIGGISAGAAAMSRVMIRGGANQEVIIDKGLGLFESAIVDQHFTQRNRLKRLLSAVERHQGQIGIGIDEGTALVVEGCRIRVIGDHQATLVLPRADRAVLLHTLRADQRADFVSIGGAENAGRFELKLAAE